FIIQLFLKEKQKWAESESAWRAQEKEEEVIGKEGKDTLGGKAIKRERQRLHNSWKTWNNFSDNELEQVRGKEEVEKL
uniref:Uncharacterized protein n=1 Tax=Suricata suricatta TaxID=37032 RepID=A0A673T990_SURSU